MDAASAFALAFDAAALGAAYALAALGFVLVINAIGAVNFAHGQMVMAGGFLSVALAQIWPAPGLVLLPAVIVGMALFGLAFSQIAYAPLAGRPPSAVFVSTIACAIAIENGANAIFGAAPRAGPALLGTGAVEIAGTAFDRQSLAILAVSVTLVLATHLVLARTQLGRTLRAAAEDAEMARALGLPVGRMIALGFAASAALAGTAGLLLSHQFFVTPVEGNGLMLKSYIAVVIGGWGRVGGALAGAVLVAAFEVGVARWLSQPVAEGLLYLALLGVLLLRPRGLFGEAAGRRV